jgi:F0F1-type ATP synthase assembly protein I
MWIVIIVLLIFGIVAGNIMLLKKSNKFIIPKDFKKRPDSDYDGDENRSNNEKYEYKEQKKDKW